MTARELAPKAKIIASIREAENQHLLRQSGADSVVVSSETAGRLLGIATTTPSVVEMIEDLLTPDAGFAIAEREVEQNEVGGSPRHLRDIVLGVVRNGAPAAHRRTRGGRHRGHRPAALHPQRGTTSGLSSCSSVPLLSRVGADRADQLRTDVDAAIAGWADAALLRVDSRNQVLVADGTRGARRGSRSSATSRRRTRYSSAASRAAGTSGRSGARCERPRTPTPKPRCSNLRRAGPIFDDTSSQLVASATALLNWHDNARFSAVDGSPTKPSRAGWSRVNPVTGHEEFPRIDPAVICLVHDGGDRAVLARQTVWPERMFSLLAGFVEAGESFEVCVVREIREEIGLTVRDVRYLGSQPWPFPRSLMVGFHALGDPDEEFSFNDGEIAEAAWFTRDEVRAALEAGDWTSARTSKLLLPGSISIAREIIESWAALD